MSDQNGAIDFSSVGGKPVSPIDFSSVGGKPVTAPPDASPYPIAEGDKGSISGIADTAGGALGMPKAIWHALTNDPQDDEEKQMETLMGRGGLAMHRLIAKPMQKSNEVADAYQKIADEKKAAAGKPKEESLVSELTGGLIRPEGRPAAGREYDPNKGALRNAWNWVFSGNAEDNGEYEQHMANVHRIASLTPLAGSSASDMVEHYQQGDPSGAAARLLTLLAAGKATDAVTKGVAKQIKKVAPIKTVVAGEPTPVMAGQMKDAAPIAQTVATEPSPEIAEGQQSAAQQGVKNVATDALNKQLDKFIKPQAGAAAAEVAEPGTSTTSAGDDWYEQWKARRAAQPAGPQSQPAAAQPADAGFKPGQADSAAYSMYGKENFSDLTSEQQAAVRKAYTKTGPASASTPTAQQVSAALRKNGAVPSGAFTDEGLRAATGFGLSDLKQAGLVTRNAEGLWEFSDSIASEGTKLAPVDEAAQANRSYEDVQRKIDSRETELEKSGVNPARLYFSNKAEGLKGNPDWSPMPKDLEALYAERDTIGSGLMKQNTGEIAERLQKAGLSDQEITRVMRDQYSLKRGGTTGDDHYLATEHTQRAALRDPRTQAKEIYIKLADERGIPMDNEDDLWRDKKTTQDAINATKAMYRYFGGELPQTDNLAPERRMDPAQRQRVADMTPEERADALLKSEKTGLPNRRAFDEEHDAAPAKAVAMSDADGLKAVNDKFGYAAGDALLKAKADALKEAGVDAYHFSGDEFGYRGESMPELQSKLDNARNILREKIISVKMADGRVLKFKGADFSYGTGNDLAEAESGLKSNKAQREANGDRARGELRGITEVGPQASQGNNGGTPQNTLTSGSSLAKPTAQAKAAGAAAGPEVIPPQRGANAPPPVSGAAPPTINGNVEPTAPITRGTANSFGDAATQVEAAAQRTFKKLDQLSDGEFSTFQNKSKMATRAERRATNIEDMESAQQAQKEAERGIDSLIEKHADQFQPDELKNAQSAWRDAQVLDKVHGYVEKAFSAPEDVAGASKTISRELKGSQLKTSLNSMLSDIPRTDLERVIGKDGVQNLYEIAELTAKPENLEKMQAQVKQLASEGAVGKLVKSPIEARNLVARYLATSPRVSNLMINALRFGTPAKVYGPLIANEIAKGEAQNKQDDTQ